MSIINANPLLAAAGGDYQISRSVRLRSSASAYFNRTPASAGNRKTWTWSGWVKRGILGGATSRTLLAAYIGSGTVDTSFFSVGFNSSDQLSLTGYSTIYRTSSAVYRDPSAWYHVVVSVDTTQATANNRLRVYVNGVEVTAFGTLNNPAQNTDLGINQAVAHYQGWDAFSSYLDGYLTEINFIDGQALTPSSFGETDAITGVWKPKKYAGTYGTNGFYLNFSDPSAATAAAIGKDSSGNGNNWTPNNISVTAGTTYDSMIDTPTPYADGGNGRGNYCTLNPLNKNASSITVLDGNLGISTSASNVGVAGTIGVSIGKWYWETTFTNASGVPSIGAVPATWDKSYVGVSSGGVGYHGNGVIYNNGTNVQSGLASYTSGDVIGVALDIGAGSITFYKNNVQQGTTVTGLTGEWFPAVAGQTSSTLAANFGQRPFAYTPPTGFKALNTQNLPDATITKGNKQFDVSLYTGTGATQSITNNGSMQPDFVWIKSRSGAESHRLYDSVRGATKSLYSNLTNAEATEAQSLTAFDATGFSLGTGAPNSNAVTYAAWQWKAGGTAVSNTAGSITSQVSANAAAGFSVVTYTGTGANATVGHGLGVAPKMVIVKSRSTAGKNWPVYHSSLASAGSLIYLNLTIAVSSAGQWNSTAPTSSVFSIGGNPLSGYDDVNLSGQTYVAYCFSEVAGYSKFGSYTGNGSADGPFVYCGFRPRFIMIKRTDTTSNWVIKDTARSAYNVGLETLYPNLSNAEGAGESWDATANGLKLRSSSTEFNASGGTYIFMALAENPFKNSLAR